MNSSSSTATSTRRTNESGLQARAVTLALRDFVRTAPRQGAQGPALEETLRAQEGIELVSDRHPERTRRAIPFRVAGYGAEWNGKTPARLVVEDSVRGTRRERATTPTPSLPESRAGMRRRRGVAAKRGEPFELLIAVA